MREMFAHIRWRLVAWTMLVVALILTFLGAAVYAALSRSLLDQVDRNLDSRADQASDNLAALAAGERDEEREGYRGGVFYLVLGPGGQVLANPQQVRTSGVSLPRSSGERVRATVVMDDEPVRVYARPLRGRVPAGTTLLVGQSLEAERNALRDLLLILVAGGGVGLLLSFAGAWFLAGRALVPIEQAFVRQQHFVADASHELRTPLTILRSATDLLDQHRQEPLTANEELFDDVRAEIARMERLTSDLLTLARSDRGELELAVAPVDLAALAGEVVRRADPLAQAGQVWLTFQPEEEIPPAEVDPDRVQQILLILLDNAIKHTPADGRVEVRLLREGGSAVLEVADSGEGIAPEHLPRIFDRFYRADSARTRQQGGTGLGLAIAKMLVEAHGGELSLESTVGVGTRAVVRLPLNEGGESFGQRVGGLASRLGHAPHATPTGPASRASQPMPSSPAGHTTRPVPSGPAAGHAPGPLE